MAPIVTDVSGFSGRLLPGALAPDVEAAAEIAAHWRRARAAKPALFDGRVLLAGGTAIAGGRFEAEFFETGYSTYLWLKDGGRARYPIRNVFAAAAVVSRDGAVLLGRMAGHTAMAGQIYFPCGTPDRGDLVGDSVDLEGSLARELMEEAGLEPPLVAPGDRRLVVADGLLTACVRRIETALDAGALKARAEAHAAREKQPELDAFFLVRSAAELTPASPPYLHAAVAALLG